MSVTVKQIAELAGVSRGTVDRALNGRGNVRPEIEKKILEIAREMGYTPNRAGKALAYQRKNLSFGIIANADGNEFFDDLKVDVGFKESQFDFSHGVVDVALGDDSFSAEFLKCTLKFFGK